MARFIGEDRRQDVINSKLTFTALKRLVGAELRFIELLSGDVMVVSADATLIDPRNEIACSVAGPKHGPVHGNAVVLTMEELE